MKIKAAIFDLDGTLLDSMKAWKNLGRNYLKSKGITPESDLKAKLGGLSLSDGAVYLSQKYEITDSTEKIIADINAIIKNFYCNEVLLKEGAYDFLCKLKENGVKICLATASGDELSKAALERNGVLGFFDTMFFYCDKSKPDIYEEALLSLDTPKETCVVFEDALHAVKNAQKAGLTVCGVYEKCQRPKKRVEEISDLYIKTFADAEKLFTF